jgi:hypothetical protein
MYIFSRLTPATFWLPMDIPDFSQRCSLYLLFFWALFDPFVRFVLYFPLPSVFSICPVSFSGMPILHFPVFFSYLLPFAAFSCARGGTFFYT